MVGILACSSALYLHDLGRAPVYLGWDEARTAVQGYALATTGRDMNGTPSPLFFHITDPLDAQQQHDHVVAADAVLSDRRRAAGRPARGVVRPACRTSRSRSSTSG